MKRFWVRWHQDLSTRDDHCPITPLPKNFYGYWCAGYEFEDTYAELVACLDAKDKKQVHELVSTYWPEFSGKWAVFEERPLDWIPNPSFFAPYET